MSAQEPIQLTRLMESIQIDGIRDEPEWQKIEPLPMTMNRPTYPGEPTEKTEIRLAYDKDYLYCSALGRSVSIFSIFYSNR